MKNLANVETFFGSKVDDLPFAVTLRISPAHIREANVMLMCKVAHVCEDQMKTLIAFVHPPGEVRYSWVRHTLAVGAVGIILVLIFGANLARPISGHVATFLF